MTELTQLRHLMTEIGTALDLSGVAEYGEEGTWALVVDAGTEVWAEWDPDSRHLMLAAEIAEPPDEGRLQLYESLLIYNHQKQRTGGVRITLPNPSAPLVLGLDVAFVDLDLARMAQVLDGFLDIQRAWREILNSGGFGNKASASQAESTLDIDPGIKV